MRKILFGTCLFVCSLFSVQAQYSTINAHSHNDYSQDIPFFLAYKAHFGSIEADIWAVDGAFLLRIAKLKSQPHDHWIRFA